MISFCTIVKQMRLQKYCNIIIAPEGKWNNYWSPLVLVIKYTLLIHRTFFKQATLLNFKQQNVKKKKKLWIMFKEDILIIQTFIISIILLITIFVFHYIIIIIPFLRELFWRYIVKKIKHIQLLYIKYQFIFHFTVFKQN